MDIKSKITHRGKSSWRIWGGMRGRINFTLLFSRRERASLKGIAILWSTTGCVWRGGKGSNQRKVKPNIVELINDTDCCAPHVKFYVMVGGVGWVTRVNIDIYGLFVKIFGVVGWNMVNGQVAQVNQEVYSSDSIKWMGSGNLCSRDPFWPANFPKGSKGGHLDALPSLTTHTHTRRLYFLATPSSSSSA